MLRTIKTGILPPYIRIFTTAVYLGAGSDPIENNMMGKYARHVSNCDPIELLLD